MAQIAATSGPRTSGCSASGRTAPSGWSPTRRYARTSIPPMSGSIPEPESRRARFAADDESAASMATEAGRRALANAGLTATDIDGVIVTTNTHFLQTPPAAPMVAAALGAKDVLGFDISAGCAGFGYALCVAADMIRGGSATKMLVVGTEKLSPTIDMPTAATASSSPTAPPQWWWVRHPSKALGRPLRAATAKGPMRYARTSTGSRSRRTQVAHARSCGWKVPRCSVGRHSKWATSASGLWTAAGVTAR